MAARVQRLYGGAPLESAVLELLRGLPDSFWPRPCKRVRKWREQGNAVSSRTGAYHQARQRLPLSIVQESCDRIFNEPSLIVLAFAFALALLTGVIFGAAPAWFATRTDPVEALRGAGRSISDQSSFARKALLILQATLSIVLVAGATMLGRSLNKLEHQDFGYRLDNRVVVSINSPPATYTQPQLAALYRQIEQRLDNLPGVQGSGLALYNPLTNNWGELVLLAGHPAPKMSEEAGSSWDRVSANYLQNFGITLLRGRNFTAADNENTAPVAIVNEAFVKRFFKHGEDPLNQHFGLDLPENANTFQIVGSCAMPSSQASAYGGQRGQCSTCHLPRTSITRTR